MVLAALVVPLVGVASANHTTVNADPNADTNPQFSRHTVTVATSAASQEVNFVIEAGPNVGETFTCNTDAATPFECSINYLGDSGAGTDDIRAFVDEGADNDTFDPGEPNELVFKTWQARNFQNDDEINCVTPGGGAELANCNDTNPTSQNAHNITVRVTDNTSGEPIEMARVVYNETGGTAAGDTTPNQIICPATDQFGECTFTITNATPADGDTVTFVICETPGDDVCDAGDPQVTGTKTWATSAGTNLNCVNDVNNNNAIDGGDTDTDTNATGTPHQILCQVTDQFGASAGAGTQVDGEILAGSANDADGTTAPPDFSDTTDGAGQVQFTYTGNVSGPDQLCFWVDANGDNLVPGEGDCGEADPDADETNDDTDRLTKTWQAGGAIAQRLDCYNVGGPNAPHDESNEIASNRTDSTHTWECRATDTNNAPVQNVVVHVEVTGVNDPDGANQFSPNSPDRTCTTNAAGTCQFTHDPGGVGAAAPPGATGVTTYRAWIDTDGNTTVEADVSEGRNALTDPGSTAEPDNTDVVEKRWFNLATTLTITPTTDTATSGTCNAFTVTLTDGAVPVAGANIDVRQRSNTFNTAGPHLDPGFCGVPGGATDPNPSGTAQSVDGALTGESFGETTGTTDANGQLTFYVSNDTIQREGTVTVLAWCEDVGLCQNANDDEVPQGNEPQAQATKTWTPGGGDAVENVNALPDTDTNPEGSIHQFTVTLTNQGGQPVPGVTPIFRITGGPNTNMAGQPVACGGPTDNAGTTTCQYTDSTATLPGTDTIEVWVDQSAASGGGTANVRDAGEPRDTITKTWAPPPNNIRLDVRCESSPNGAFLGDTDTGVGNSLDCFNPLTEQNEVFQARAFNTQGTGDLRDDTVASGIVIQWDITGETVNNEGAVPAGRSIDFVPANQGADNGPVFCTTDATGRCTVTVRNTQPDNGDRVDVRGTVAGQTNFGAGNNQDTASKAWQVARAFLLVLDPEGDTNPNNTSHSIVATVTNQFGQPQAGVNVDFDITDNCDPVGPVTAAPSRNRDITQPAGFVEGADRTTNAQGQATFTYNDGGQANTDGFDCINAWADVLTENDADQTGAGEPGAQNPRIGTSTGEPDDDAVKFWRQQPPTTTTVRLDMDQDDVPNTDPGSPDPDDIAGPPFISGEGFGTDPTECPSASNSTDFENIDNNNDSDVFGAGQPAINDVNEICATSFDQNNNQIVGGTYTFTITGAAVFTNATGTADLGKTRTVASDELGFAHAFITSASAGSSTVTVTKDGQSATGTYSVGAAPRTISCTDPTEVNRSPGSHTIVCTLRDNTGAPAPGALVDAGENGPGRLQGDPANPCGASAISGFESEGCDISDSSGQVQFELITDTGVEGTQSVTAVISADLPPGGNPNIDDNNIDECDRPAGNPAGSPQGVCLVRVDKQWSPTAPTQTITTPPSEEGFPVEITLQADKRTRRFGKRFNLTGSLSPIIEGTTPPECTNNREVILERVISGETTLEEVARNNTDENGLFSFTRRADKSATYIARVEPILNPDGTGLCDDAASPGEETRVKKAVALKIRRKRVARGSTVRLRVVVRPCAGHAGERVTLWKSVSGTMARVGSKRTNDNCVANFFRKIRRPSVYQGRSPKQDADHQAGRSNKVAIQIRRR